MEFRLESEVDDAWSGCADLIISERIATGKLSTVFQNLSIEGQSKPPAVVIFANAAEAIAAHQKAVGLKIWEAAGREGRLARLTQSTSNVRNSTFVFSGFSRTQPTYA
jgi:hypothetical protein